MHHTRVVCSECGLPPQQPGLRTQTWPLPGPAAPALHFTFYQRTPPILIHTLYFLQSPHRNAVCGGSVLPLVPTHFLLLHDKPLKKSYAHRHVTLTFHSLLIPLCQPFVAICLSPLVRSPPSMPPTPTHVSWGSCHLPPTAFHTLLFFVFLFFRIQV